MQDGETCKAGLFEMQIAKCFLLLVTGLGEPLRAKVATEYSEYQPWREVGSESQIQREDKEEAWKRLGILPDSIVRPTPHMCSKGFEPTESEGVDYQETFLPSSTHSLIHLYIHAANLAEPCYEPGTVSAVCRAGQASWERCSEGAHGGAGPATFSFLSKPELTTSKPFWDSG